MYLIGLQFILPFLSYHHGCCCWTDYSPETENNRKESLLQATVLYCLKWGQSKV